MNTYLNCAIAAPVVAAAVALPTQAASFTSIDQFNLEAPSRNINVGDFLQPVGQRFVPALDRLNQVQARISDAGSDIGTGANLRAYIRQGTPTGPILGTSDIVLVPDDFAGLVTFPFPEDVSVFPGFLYSIQVENLDDGFSRPGSGNFMWSTSSSDDDYPRGSASTGQPDLVMPDGDFIFTTGLVQENRLDAVPTVIGAVEEDEFGFRTLEDGGFIDELDRTDNRFGRETRAVIEYDLAQLGSISPHSIRATLVGRVSANNSLDLGPRSIDIEIYSADLAVTLDDFDAPAQVVADVLYQPPFDSSAPFDLDVTDEIASLLADGADAIGFRFDPTSIQAPSVISASTPPILIIEVIPEPATLALLAFGLAPLVTRRRALAGKG